MIDTIARYLSGITEVAFRQNLLSVINPIADRQSSQFLTTAGLVIKAGGSALAKAGTLSYGIVQGDIVKVAANTDMAALSGTVTNAKFNVYAFFIDSASVLTTSMGTEGATLASVVFPAFPEGKACVGFVIINPTGTGNFVGGTTPLDDATVVPNAAYVNATSGFDPSILLR